MECQPYVCPFPRQAPIARGTRWTCPNCGYTYRMSRRYPRRPWRNWCAPYGRWTLTFAERLRFGRTLR